MSSTSGLASAPLLKQGFFNWTYLIGFIVDGILALFFLFYFNRVIATVLSYAIRLFTWHKFRVYIDIEAIQVSLLAGRIFFKGIRYHGDNVTVYIHSGYITWRYWLSRVKDCDLFLEGKDASERKPSSISSNNENSSEDDTESGGKRNSVKAKQLPCRISVKVSGVEAFVYNRTPAYDFIVESVQNRDHEHGPSRAQTRDAQEAEKSGYPPNPHGHASKILAHVGLSNIFSRSSESSPLAKGDSGSSRDDPPLKQERAANDLNLVETTGSSVRKYNPPSPPSILRLLPVHVECETGAAVLGNENTRSIITAKFDSASGEFDATHAGPLDYFKILMNFDVVHPFVQMKPNVDFARAQLAEAAVLKRDAQQNDHASVGDLYDDDSKGLFKRKFGKRPKINVQSLAKFWPLGSKSSESIAGRQKKIPQQDTFTDMHGDVTGHQRWIGLKRYLEDSNTDENDEWDPIEYGTSSTLADITSVGFKFSWDIPGPVPPRGIMHELNLPNTPEDINGTTPPAYGMEIAVRGGNVSYGPWADRHRIVLQQLFFPAPYANAQPAKSLRTGESRYFTIFDLFLSIEGDTVLRVPFREPSKDWKWKGRAATMASQASAPNVQRRFRGKRKGSKATEGDKGNVRTDVRPFAWFDVRVAAGTTVSYRMDMVPNKKGYCNDLGVDVANLEVFSSLNHGLLWRSGKIGMNCDLSNPLAWNGLREWQFNIDIHDLDLFILRDHTFLLVDLIGDWSSGPPQDFYTFAPYRYHLNVHFQNFKMYLNTNAANLVNNQDDLDDNHFLILYGRVLDADLRIPLDRLRPVQSDISFDVTSDDLGFEVSFPPKSTLHVLQTDKNVARLNRVILKGIYTQCMEYSPGMTDTFNLDVTGIGFSINFFGFIAHHLVLLKENYFGEDVHFRTREEYQNLLLNGFESEQTTNPNLKSNDLDVILDITAIDATIVLPAGVYECDENIVLHVDTVDVDLRVTNYYLELMVNSYPLEISYTARTDLEDPTIVEQSGTQLFIDGVEVYGHRFFGFAPREPPYVSNWDVNAGKISGDCVDKFFEKFARAAQSFALTFNDEENAMPVPHILPIHDATFVRFKCPEIRLGCHVGDAAFLVDMESINGSFDDWAGKLFSQRLKMFIPRLVCACVDGEAVLRQRSDRKAVETYAHIQTALSLNMVQRSVHFDEQKALQQHHIRFHDRKRHRAQFLIHDVWDRDPSSRPTPGSGTATVSLQLPVYPQPLNLHDEDETTQESTLPVNTPVGKSEKEGAAVEDSQNFKHTDQARTNVSLTSPFKSPFFPLTHFRPDVSDVPLLPKEQHHHQNADPIEADFDASSLDDDELHTSVIINVDPGLTAYVKPKAVYVVADLMQTIMPKQPQDLLDQWQFSTIMKVVSRRAVRRGKRTVTDVSLKVPFVHVRAINEFEQEYEEGSPFQSSDRYNFVAKDIGVLIRKRLTPETKLETGSTAAHVSLSSLRLSAHEGVHEAEDEEAAFQANVSDVLVWLVEGDRTSVNTSFRTAELAVTSKNINYLASVVHRTVILLDDAQGRFAELLGDWDARLRVLVHKLVTHGTNEPDPVFFTRPSNFIRSAKDHLRNSDSWKIISKLRYTFLSLSQDEKAALYRDCIAWQGACPADWESQVLAQLDQWQSWDSLTMKTCIAIQTLYGPQDSDEKEPSNSSPLNLAVRAAGVKVIIDPGSKQNEFAISNISVGVNITPPTPTSSLAFFKEYKELQTTVVQVNTSWISLRLNWSICEFIDQLLTLFEKRSPKHLDAVNAEAARVNATGGGISQKFHIVFVSQLGDIQLDTINLRQGFASEGLKISATGSGWTPAEKETLVNVMLAADAINGEMTGPKGCIWTSKVSAPNLWIAYEFSEEERLEAIRIAGDSNELKFEAKQEIVDLIQMANTVVTDEAAYLDRVIQKHSKFSAGVLDTHATEPDGTQPAGSPNRERTYSNQLSSTVTGSPKVSLNLALFLNIYDLEIPILRDISYRFVGKTMRTSITPHPTLASTYNVNCDLKNQTHRLINVQESKKQVWATLKMPPVNGSARIFQSIDVATVSVQGSMEKLELEGSAIYNIASAFGGTKFLSAVEAIKAESLDLAEQIQETFPGQSSPAPKSRVDTPARTVIFDGDFVLVGLEVSAEAPASRMNSKPSNLLFCLSTLQARVSNRSGDKANPFPFPEMRVTLQKISLEVRRLKENTNRVCGRLLMSAFFTCTMEQKSFNQYARNFQFQVIGPGISMEMDSAIATVEILDHFQNRLKELEVDMEHRYIKKLRHPMRKFKSPEVSPTSSTQKGGISFVSNLQFNLRDMRLAYVVGDSVPNPSSRENEDLVLTMNRLSLLTRSEAEARLQIDELQLALEPPGSQADTRPRTSALMPEIIFNVAHKSSPTDRKFAVQLHGKVLDLRLDPHFILPVSDLERSITIAVTGVRRAASNLRAMPNARSGSVKDLFGKRKVSFLLFNASFGGAEVHMQGRRKEEMRKNTIAALNMDRVPEHGRYNQFSDGDSSTRASLTAPGIAARVQYEAEKIKEPTLNIEVRIDASTNVLFPAVVPLMMQISDSVQKVVQEAEPEKGEGSSEPESESEDEKPSSTTKMIDEESLVQADPRAVLGRTKLNVGFRICRQEFGLRCQPIARIAASTKIEDIYITINTVESLEHGHFFAASVAFKGLSASLKHDYSREATFSFDMESIVISLMNSKHLDGAKGISAILRINPAKTKINAKQLQHILLFREIWLPPEIRNAPAWSESAPSDDPQEFFVQKYQQIAASTAFPWSATVAIAKLEVDLDLGQAIGKMSFNIEDFWASSKKTSNSRQNLSIGITDVRIGASGRMSGFVALENVKVRTFISWPPILEEQNKTPLIQGSVGFERVEVKAAYDYQAFACADISNFEFIMYNTRDEQRRNVDRLVAILDGDKVNVYCISSAAALGYSLILAFERLFQDTKSSYDQALGEIARFLRRRPSVQPRRSGEPLPRIEEVRSADEKDSTPRVPISLQTDVVVTLRGLDVGWFPSTLLDHQVLKGEASDVQARFAVVVEGRKIHSGLGITLGQLRVGLATVPNPSRPKTLGEITVREVVENAAAARGGTILRVPKVIAAMQTWQASDLSSNLIEYLFKSRFEGKIDIGWNYSRIGFIKGMWTNHTKTLASRFGKPLPEPALKITSTAAPSTADQKQPDGAAVDGANDSTKDSQDPQQKITAVVNLPQSKYIYRALEPPIIDTPQLRDMGEATPPLEWIGLHRDKLPNVTHQIIIVTLLEIAKEVEDAYSHVLGSAR